MDTRDGGRGNALSSPARLAAVAATGLSDAPPEEGFDRLTAMARRLTGAPFAFVTVVDDQRSYWLSRQGLPADGASQNTVEESFCQYVVATGAPVVVPDATADERTRDNPSIASMGLHAWAGFPVHTPDGEVLGTFCVADTEVRQWTADDVALLADLAEIASREVRLRAVAAQSRHSRDAAQEAAAAAQVATGRARQEAARAGMLARIAELLTAGLRPADVWQSIATLAVPALGDCAYVCAVEPDGGLVPVAARHRDPDQLGVLWAWLHVAGRRLGETAGPGHVVVTGQVETVDLAARADLSDVQRDVTARLSLCSALVVPLMGDGSVVAVLVVARQDGSDPYGDDDVAMVQALADRAALVVRNALVYDLERRLSETMQRALLPAELPQPQHLQITARYLPAGQAQLVGGDWYDAFLDTGGSTSVVIGDVAGHDIAAASTMGQLRTMLRMAGHDGSRSPGGVLSTVDDVLDTFGHAVFATALIAQVEPGAEDTATGSRWVRWSSAGHPPPVLLTADGQVQVLPDRPGLPLGVQPSAPRPDHTTLLPPSSTLVLFTDGLIERRDRDLDEGLAQLTAVLADAAGDDLEALADRLVKELLPAAGADDDVALIIVRSAAAAG